MHLSYIPLPDPWAGNTYMILCADTLTEQQLTVFPCQKHQNVITFVWLVVIVVPCQKHQNVITFVCCIVVLRPR